MILDMLKKANIEALKAHDSNKRGVLSFVLNKVKLAEIDKRTQNAEITQADVVAILQKTVKELAEERDAFCKAGRQDNVDVLNGQIEYISTFLPQMMSHGEIADVIMSLDDKSIPAVMRHFKANYAGKCNMVDVQAVLKSLQ